MLEYWKIVALVGAVIFGVSVFLPVYSALGFSRSLLDEYQDLGSIDWGSAFSSYPASAVGLLLLAILWPIALVLCIVSIFKHRIALAAGAVGIICWIGAIMYIMGGPASGLIQYGAGIFVGFAGAIVLLVAYYIKPKPVTSQVLPPQVAPPPPPQQ